MFAISAVHPVSHSFKNISVCGKHCTLDCSNSWRNVLSTPSCLQLLNTSFCSCYHVSGWNKSFKNKTEQNRKIFASKIMNRNKWRNVKSSILKRTHFLQIYSHKCPKIHFPWNNLRFCSDEAPVQQLYKDKWTFLLSISDFLSPHWCYIL